MNGGPLTVEQRKDPHKKSKISQRSALCSKVPAKSFFLFFFLQHILNRQVSFTVVLLELVQCGVISFHIILLFSRIHFSHLNFSHFHFSNFHLSNFHFSRLHLSHFYFKHFYCTYFSRFHIFHFFTLLLFHTASYFHPLPLDTHMDMFPSTPIQIGKDYSKKKTSFIISASLLHYQ